ncbi:hypothetical protein [Ramlibacter rhizophilus]|uniref:Histidine phosphatase family protein n=1 Tax=Ramlibacter rhizophilus TaxID=1781167 RepID=A0A4Z0BK36_9BURK|nr:hypothetical protein [Ramlibacter rhizophilus]TFY98617.1 hypothetical protein EZ242_13880 [Ramlibacter rhizophilus]
MPSPIVLLRHAEKPDPARGIGGVDERGAADDRSLSVRGWQRAGALSRWLAPAEAPGPFGEAAACWAAGTSAVHTSLRPVQTLVPLARRLGLGLRDDLDSDEPDGAAAQMPVAGGTLVVAWRQDSLPALARSVAARLGAPASIPPQWPADCFDLLWVFRPHAGGWRFEQHPQRLLDGDRTSGLPLA